MVVPLPVEVPVGLVALPPADVGAPPDAIDVVPACATWVVVPSAPAALHAVGTRRAGIQRTASIRRGFRDICRQYPHSRPDEP